MSAIEVLKGIRNRIPLNFICDEVAGTQMWEGKEIKALGEAVLALE
jgi:hypothetical protein